LAWRKRFSRPAALDVIADAVRDVRIPGLVAVG
jgi:hypothetical protein